MRFIGRGFFSLVVLLTWLATPTLGQHAAQATELVPLRRRHIVVPGRMLPTPGRPMPVPLPSLAHRPRLNQDTAGLSHAQLDSPHRDKTRLFAYPTLGYAPETRIELGAGALVLFRSRDAAGAGRGSQISANGFYTLRKQYGLWSDHAVYLRGDEYFFLGRFRLQKYPTKFYGVGRQPAGTGYYVLDGSYLLYRERVMRGLGRGWFGGIQADYQHLWGNALKRYHPQEAHIPALPEGWAGSSNLGLGMALIYDTRPALLNPRRGAFLELSGLRYAKAWGSDYHLTTVLVDARRYLRGVGGQQVLALQGYVQAVVEGTAPYNLLPAIGGEQLMRGYYTGRYRDRAYAAAQAEYRRLPLPFSHTFGCTVFAAAGALAPTVGQLRSAQGHLAAGAGLRYLILPSKDAFVRADFALTGHGMGMYFFLGEAF